MDTEIKRKYPRLRKYGWIAAASALLFAGIAWAIAASRSTVYTADGNGILIGEVKSGNFDDFIRLTGRWRPNFGSGLGA